MYLKRYERIKVNQIIIYEVDEKSFSIKAIVRTQ